MASRQPSLRRLGTDLCALVAVGLLAACGASSGSVPAADAVSERPNPSAGRDVPSPTSPATVPPELEDLAARLACDQIELVEPVPTDGPVPLATVDCYSGDVMRSVAMYERHSDAKDALSATLGCGYRAVGERWIVSVNTRESAEEVVDVLGGDVRQLTDCP